MERIAEGHAVAHARHPVAMPPAQVQYVVEALLCLYGVRCVSTHGFESTWSAASATPSRCISAAQSHVCKGLWGAVAGPAPAAASVCFRSHVPRAQHQSVTGSTRATSSCLSVQDLQCVQLVWQEDGIACQCPTCQLAARLQTAGGGLCQAGALAWLCMALGQRKSCLASARPAARLGAMYQAHSCDKSPQ